MWNIVVYARELISTLKAFNPYHDRVLLQPSLEGSGLNYYWPLEKCTYELWSSYLWEVTVKGILFYIWCCDIFLWKQYCLLMDI